MINAETQEILDDLFMALLHAHAKRAGVDMSDPNPYILPSMETMLDIKRAAMEQYNEVTKPIVDAMLKSFSPPPIIIKAGDWEGYY